jgi:hypothetical protein
MIRQTEPVFWLRSRTVLGAAVISAALFSVLPLAAIACCAAGGLVIAACWLLLIVLAIVAIVGMVVGGILALTLLGSNGDKAGVAGFLGLFVGFVAWWAFRAWREPVAAAGGEALSACLTAAGFLFFDVFIGGGVWLACWSVFAFTALAAIAVLLTILSLHIGEALLRRARGVLISCPQCHRRGCTAHRCSNCGKPVLGLCPTKYGVWEASCGHCGQRLPTLDVVGRGELQRSCAVCELDLQIPGLGSAAEVHIAVIGQTAPEPQRAFLESTSAQRLKAIKFAAHNWVKEFNFPSRRVRVLKVKPPMGRKRLAFVHEILGAEGHDAHRMAGDELPVHPDGVVFLVSAASEARDANSPNPLALAGRLLASLERAGRLRAGARLPIPVAVVVARDAGNAKALLALLELLRRRFGRVRKFVLSPTAEAPFGGGSDALVWTVYNASTSRRADGSNCSQTNLMPTSSIPDRPPEHNSSLRPSTARMRQRVSRNRRIHSPADSP